MNWFPFGLGPSFRLAIGAAFLLTCGPLGTLRAEDGYRLWLRYDRVQNPQRLNSYSAQIGQIVVPGDSPTLAAARDELRRGISGLLGRAVPVGEGVTGQGRLVAGTPESCAFVAGMGLASQLKELGAEGYLIRSIKQGKTQVIVIAANSDLGVLYGSFHLLRLLQTEQAIDHLDIVERPKLQRRLLNHWDNLDGSVERGYAGRSLWRWDELPDQVDPRYTDYARANASLGINGTVLNNVNSRPELLNADYLKKVAALANVFRPYGIRVYLTANFACPESLGGLPTADPLNPEVRRWWRSKADEIYARIPDFGGFLVKANSEGQPGPQDYGRTHADGANMLAEALAPHGGIVIWRAFVYSRVNADRDRAKRAYLDFKPLDGKFQDAVFVQVKNGPVDFQPREPFHPLFGALPKTHVMAELQVTQEYMGWSTHLVYLGPMWKEFFESDTYAAGKGSTVGKILATGSKTGIAGIANTGDDRNWCGHDFAQANWYTFGRLAWNSDLTADQLAEEWVRMTWSNDSALVATLLKMMRGSWKACVDYEMPLGLHHIMDDAHYGPKPSRTNKGTPDFSAVQYHKADAAGIGYNRSRTGSDAVSQYAPPVRDRFDDLNTCPPDLLLWFHHPDWDYRLKTGRTVWEELCFRYNAGVDYVKGMRQEWESVRGKVDDERFVAVQKRLAQQVVDAIRWRDTCVRYFQSVNHKALPAYLSESATP
ncbi:MAG: alpha-glucuronidase family glycosyl hydrolase [Verrucomicrobiota bacterium]